MRNLQLPGRSPAMAGEAMAATSHPLATAAALDVLKRGGNAVDAAVTAVAVMCVTEPAMTGIGGDCFALLSDAEAKLTGLNASGAAAGAASTEYFLERGITAIGKDSVHSITVPGAVRGWERLLEEHGTWGLDQALQPAIGYALNGYPVTPRVGSDWADEASKLARYEGSSRHFLNDGKAPAVGSWMKNEALGNTLQQIAKNGSSAFYTGPVAEDIVRTVRANGGLLSLEDMAAMETSSMTPITSDYRGLTVAELPPNGQGLTALIMLNILERFETGKLDPDSAERFHLQMEAGRLAYACRDATIADPASMVHDVERLGSKEFAASLAGRIDPQQRLTSLELPPLPNSDTVYLSVVDRDRRCCSLINSLYGGFGSGICSLETGVMLQNRGACFVVERGHPNTIDGGKLPMHTIIPAMALKNGRPELSFGVMGGAYQPVGHAHVISNMVDYGMDVQEAIDAPRVFWDDTGDVLRVETSLAPDVSAGLGARGHRVEDAPSPIGGGQAIRIDWEQGVLVGGSDPRKDGCALGF